MPDGLPASPFSVFYIGLSLSNTSSGAQEEGQSKIGGSVRENIGCISDSNVPAMGFIKINVVGADRKIAHDAQGITCCLHDGCINSITEHAENATAAANALKEDLASWGKRVGPDIDIAAGLNQFVEATGGDGSADKNTHENLELKMESSDDVVHLHCWVSGFTFGDRGFGVVIC